MEAIDFIDEYIPQYENDPYLEFACLELVQNMLERWQNVYNERLLEAILGIIGDESSNKIISKLLVEMSEIPETDSRYNKIERLRSEFLDETLDAREITKWTRKVLCIDRKLYQKLIQSFNNLLLVRIEKNKARIKESYFYQRLEKISTTFELSEIDKKVIVLLCMSEANTIISDLLYKDWDPKDYEKSKEVYRAYLKSPDLEIRKTISTNGKLSNIGIINFPKRNYRDFELDSSIFHYLNGLDDRPLTDKFFTTVDLDSSFSLALDDHLSDKHQTNLLLKLIQREGGTNILLYGVPGVGKTEFAKSIAKELGLTPYFINSGADNDEDKNKSVSFRRIAVQAATKILDHSKSLIIVDEADSMLNLEDTVFQSVSHTDKSWLNMFLENSNSKIIWISNQGQRIESSTRRRFNLAIEFNDLNKDKRFKIWKNQCKLLNVNFLEEDQLIKLAHDFQINAGPIAMALKDLKKLFDDELIAKDEVLPCLEKLLDGHRTFINKENQSLSKSCNVSSSYMPNFLNTSIPASKILHSLKQFHQALTLNSLPKEYQNYNILFYGPSGTGKTEYAKYVAQQLGVNLVTKRVSDLFSKWVGESEMNIANAFREIEKSESVLFLDECDSFLRDRSAAQNSHEVTRTNELLVAMENFKGILICSTNFKDGLDNAIARRFVQKVKFDYMAPEKMTEFYNEYFKRQLPIQLVPRLHQLIYLTPGDFSVVRRRMILEGIDSDCEIINLLEEEVRHKKETKSKIKI
jgi:SpoVK/Ycf46/Vps4 family AAA+-type ATPase